MEHPAMRTAEQESEIFIRPATPGDGAAVGRVVHDTWLETYPNEEAGITREDIEPAVSNQLASEYLAEKAKKLTEGLQPERLEIIASQDGHVIGIAAAAKYPDGTQKIGSVYVLPESQGLGAGRKLMERILEWADPKRPIILTVAAYNTKAIEFYRKFGFEITAEAASSRAAQLPGGKTIPEILMRRDAEEMQLPE